MKISELIEELTDRLGKHGDVDVWVATSDPFSSLQPAFTIGYYPDWDFIAVLGAS